MPLPMIKPQHRQPALLLTLLYAVFTPTEATLTIAAADKATGLVGAAGTSCVSYSLYDMVYQGVPGHGLLLTQATPATPGSPIYATSDAMLRDDAGAADILAAITDPALDDETSWDYYGLGGDVHLRQYGLVALDPKDGGARAAGYTGENIQAQYEEYVDPALLAKYEMAQRHAAGTVAGNNIYNQKAFDLAYSAQANICSNATVDLLAGSFEAPMDDGSCDDLPSRLYRALAAVTEHEERVGDIRCFDHFNASGNSIFLHVDDADGNAVVHIERTDFAWHARDGGPGADQWPAFRQAYRAWRCRHPCVGVAAPEDPEECDAFVSVNTPAPPASASGVPGLVVAVLACAMSTLACM